MRSVTVRSRATASSSGVVIDIGCSSSGGWAARAGGRAAARNRGRSPYVGGCAGPDYCHVVILGGATGSGQLRGACWLTHSSNRLGHRLVTSFELISSVPSMTLILMRTSRSCRDAPSWQERIPVGDGDLQITTMPLTSSVRLCGTPQSRDWRRHTRTRERAWRSCRRDLMPRISRRSWSGGCTTVRGLMNSRLPISGLVAPAATRRGGLGLLAGERVARPDCSLLHGLTRGAERKARTSSFPPLTTSSTVWPVGDVPRPRHLSTTPPSHAGDLPSTCRRDFPGRSHRGADRRSTSGGDWGVPRTPPEESGATVASSTAQASDATTPAGQPTPGFTR